MSNRPRRKTTAKIFGSAKAGRRKPTSAEAKLWKCLRDRQLNGLKFRRQHIVGRYVLDMYCAEQHLCIEVDGSIHEDPEQAERDRDREVELLAQGIRILRFSNVEVENEVETVLGKIVEFTRK